MPGRLLRLANAIKPFELVLSYGWGAIDVAMAHTLFGEALGLPPLVHHESTLVGEERRLSKRRCWYRRIALGRASGLVVTSERMEEIALVDWQQPMGRVKRFAPGIAIESIIAKPRADALPGVIKREGERWIGALFEDSGDVGAFCSLVTTLSKLPETWHLVVFVGDLDADPLSAQAESLEIAHRLHIARPVGELQKVIGLFDIWASIGQSRGRPDATIMAMAAAKPVLALSGSDNAALLATENAVHTASSNAALDLERAVRSLVDDDENCSSIGAANKAYAAQHYDHNSALDRYRRLYASAMRQEVIA
ncbi:glycosyltransferase family 1 protein [Altererythrobacter sp. GH1-8]|uniref:glycosyltransferase family 1 protein n=1 Tax=Altererythrobacter sp. GH1-8 TaxID=3349333 RepID=UPI00374CC05C